MPELITEWLDYALSVIWDESLTDEEIEAILGKFKPIE